MRATLAVLLALAACAAPPKPETAVATAPVFHVIKVGADDPGFGEGSDRPVLPASTVKLITAAAALEAAPLETRFRTRVCRNGDTVALIGGGDPSLDVEDLLALAQAARGGADEAVRFTYGPAGSTGRVRENQPHDAAYNPTVADLMVAEGAYRGHRGANGFGWTVPAEAPLPDTVGTDWYAHPDPPRQAANLFRQYLIGLGLRVPTPEPADSKRCDRLLARHDSDTLGALIREMLWTSSNPMAEIIGRYALAANDPSAWLARRHPDLAGFKLHNFSGLDESARLTARAMATFLARHMGEAGQGGLPPALLTPAGWDGGLRARMTEPPLALSVWAKTGTMNYGAGLAGYMLVPEKGLYAFATYVFDDAARAAYDRQVSSRPGSANALNTAWIADARAAIDRTVRVLFDRLSGPADG